MLTKLIQEAKKEVSRLAEPLPEPQKKFTVDMLGELMEVHITKAYKAGAQDLMDLLPEKKELCDGTLPHNNCEIDIEYGYNQAIQDMEDRYLRWKEFNNKG